jgi:pilus assembly protein CpaE
MEKPLQVLLASADPMLPAEFRLAMDGVANWRAIIHQAATFPAAVEIAFSRHPQLICLEMTNDNRELISIARELQATLPGTAIAAIYSPEQLGSSASESAVIIEVLRANVQDFLRRPLSSTEVRQLLDRLFLTRGAKRTTSGKILSFVSNKGGVGKSTIAVSAACALARQHPDRVLLVDASLQLGVCAVMLDLQPATTLADAVRERDRLDEGLLRRMTAQHECGLSLLAAPPNAVEATDIDDSSIARILNLARRSYDYVVVDTFPMLDSIVMAIIDLCDLVYIVTQSTAPNIVGMARFLPLLEGLGLPKDRQRLVLNQNFKNFAGNLTVADVEERIGRQIDYLLPYQKRLMTAMNTGRPYILRCSRWWGFGRAISELIHDIGPLELPDQSNNQQAPVPEQREFAARGGSS